MCILILWHMLPKGRACLERTEKTDARRLVRAVLSPRMLPLFLCGGIPQALADGYGSLIFPLFMNSSGVSDASISALTSLGDAIACIFGPPIDKAQEAFGSQALIFGSLLGLAVIFAPFALNQTVVWAVAAIVVVNVLIEFLDEWYWYQFALMPEFGYKGPQGQPLLDIEDKICNTIQPIALGSLMTTGTLSTCLLLAVYFFVDALVFGAIARKQDKATQERA